MVLPTHLFALPAALAGRRCKNLTNDIIFYRLFRQTICFQGNLTTMYLSVAAASVLFVKGLIVYSVDL